MGKSGFITQPLTLRTPNNMNMRTTSRAFKETGNEDFFFCHNNTTNRTYPVTLPLEAVKASFNMHEPVIAAIHGRKGRCAYRFLFTQLCGAYRADLRITCRPFTLRLGAAGFL